jgi:GNAT superfamily N-acetyltransferase
VTSSAISIRFAKLEDLERIGLLAHQIWPETYKDILSETQISYMMNLFYSSSSLKNQMVDFKHVFILIEQEGDLLGFASYSCIKKPGVYKLHKIYVLPNQQGKGLGKAIIDFILADIGTKNATALQLNVNRINKARFFYERLGFTVIGEQDTDIGHDYFMNDFVMEKPLV